MASKITIRQARNLRRLSVKQLADRMNTDESVVKAWEDGSVSPNARQLVGISFALRLPVSLFSLT